MRFRIQNTLALFLLAFPCLAFARKLAPEIEYAMGNGADAKISLKVCDDEGLPVSNTSVSVEFDLMPDPHSVYGKTDSNGIVVVKGKTNGNRISCIVEKDGYYGSRAEMSFVTMGAEHDVKDGKWQPYPTDKTVVIRRIRHPGPLVHTCAFYEVPATNVWLGFDMKVRDFVAPDGSGEVADFECQVEWDGLPPAKSKFCKMSLRLPGVLSGGYYYALAVESDYPFSYFAKCPPELVREIEVVNRNGNPHTTKVPFREQSEFVTRTRCKVDNHNQLIKANYGSIRGLSVSPSWDGNPTLRLNLVFNADPNDTNLEPIRK